MVIAKEDGYIRCTVRIPLCFGGIMAAKKKIGNVRSDVQVRKHRGGSRITGNVPGGTRATTQQLKPRSKTLGAIKIDSNIGEQRWDGEHIRQGIRLSGDVAVWVEEAAHYLGMALCTYLGHIGSPCTSCIKWAEQKIAFAIIQKGVEEDNDELRNFGNRLNRAIKRVASILDLEIVSRVQAGTKSNRRKTKSAKRSSTKKN